MRFLDLTLDRYGALADRRITFRPDALVHVVVGRNEAGKSTTLEAIGDLLFGFPARTPWAFEHPTHALAVSATLRNRAGAELRLTRRKTKPLLTDGAGAEIFPDALLPFTGSLTRPLFERAFGLDQKRLELAGNELKESKGDLAAALFAAASGLRGLNELKSTLDREADDLFSTTQRRKYALNDAIQRRHQAEKTIRDRELRASELKRLRGVVTEAETALEGVTARRRMLDRDRRQIELLVRAAPVIARIDGALADLARLPALPEATAGIGERLKTAIVADAAARGQLQEAEATLATLTAERTGIAEAPEFLACEGDIVRLYQAVARISKARTDLPGVEREMARLSGDLDLLAARLGLADGRAVEGGRPDDARLADIAAAIDEGLRLRDELTRARRELAERETEFARLTADPARQQAGDDPREARRQLDALTVALRPCLRAEEEAPRLAEERRQLAEEALRLEPPVTDLEAVATRALPGSAALNEAEARLNADAEALRAAGQTLASEEAALRQAEARLREASRGGEIPSPADLAARRAERDRLWRAARDALLQPESHAEAERRTFSDDFEAALIAADRSADALIIAADRVGALRLAEADCTAAAVRLSEARAAEAAAHQTRAEAETGWWALWAPVMAEPAGPATMRIWRAGLDGLTKRLKDLRLRGAELDGARREGERLATALEALAGDLRLPAMPLLPMAVRAARIEQEVVQREESWRAAEKARGEGEILSRQIAEARRTAESLASAGDRWRQEVRPHLGLLGLDPEASPEAARARLAAWREAPPILRELSALRRAAAAMTEEIAGFEAEARALVLALAPDQAERPSDFAIGTLAERLQAARDARIRAEGLDGQILRLRAEIDRLAGAREKAAAHLAELGHLAGLEATADGAALAERADLLGERDRLSIELAAARAEMAGHLGVGESEATVREALAGFDAAAADATLRRIETERDGLDAEADRHNRTRGEAQQTLTGHEMASDAEAALQDKLAAEAEIAEIAGDWLTKRLAGLMLGTAIARQRAAHHGPLMARAGAHFQTLSGGAFAGLIQIHNDQDVPEIRCLRAGSGREVEVAGLSEGTRHQLFLALKLAWLEDFAARSEPVPFIGDDLFASFDDARTAHGLKALSGIGAEVQPILFTHHDHVAVIALETLGAAADIIRLE